MLDLTPNSTYIGTEFSRAYVDLVLVDELTDLHQFMIRFIHADEEGKIIKTVGLQTGLQASGLLGCAYLLDNLISFGFFAQQVYSTGMVISREGKVTSYIDWNELIAKYKHTVVFPETTTPS